MNDENPLIQSTTSTSPSTIIRRYENGDPLEKLARVWSCSRCGWLLGFIHIALGVIITLFDLLTSPVTNNSYAISAAILYIICGVLCFIATRQGRSGSQSVESSVELVHNDPIKSPDVDVVEGYHEVSGRMECALPVPFNAARSESNKARVDRCTQLLLMGFATAALLISTAIFIESATILNSSCHTEHCDEQRLVVHSILVFVSLSEFLTSLATLIVCFRSLYGAVAVNHANSPYSTLIIGDYSILRRPARIFCPRFHNRPQKSTELPASTVEY